MRTVQRITYGTRTQVDRTAARIVVAVEDTQTETAPGRRGRPRDPNVEDKVYDAAIRLYAQTGWAGFTFEAVARETGIGKPALYRRWSSRGELLAQTFRARWFDVERIDTGSLRDDLHALARTTLDHMLSSHGRVVLRMLLDTPDHPEVAASTASYREGVTAAARGIVRTGVRRGELPSGTSPTLVLDMIVGAVMNRVHSTPPELFDRMVAGSEEFVDALVNAVLRGLGTGNGEK